MSILKPTKIKLVQLGYIKPVIIAFENAEVDQIVFSSKQDVGTICEIINRLLPYIKREIWVSTKDFNSAKQRTVSGAKSVYELFLENGYTLKEDKENT